MLAVLAIMGIIMGITVAGFTAIGRTTAASAGARQIHAAIKLARQYAVSRRIPVAFLVCDADFADRTGSLDATLDPEKYIGKAYAVYDLRHRTYLQGWRELPKSIVFDGRPIDDFEEMVGGVRKSISRGENIEDDMFISAPIPFPNQWSSNGCSFYGMEFQTDGRVSVKGAPSRPRYRWVILSEGSYNPADEKWKVRGRGMATAKTVIFATEAAHAGNVRIAELKSK